MKTKPTKKGEKRVLYPTISRVLADFAKRLKRIEEWIDLWETYDSGWNKYRKSSPKKPTK